MTVCTHELVGQLHVCPIGELEQLHSARSAADYDALRDELHQSFECSPPVRPLAVRRLG